VAAGALSLPACGGSSSSTASSATTTSAAGATLAPAVIIPLTVVRRYFPEVTREGQPGQDKSAAGRSTGTRLVVFANGNGSRKVTLSVNHYSSASDALSAFEQAVQGSKSAPGAKSAAAPALGQKAFAGTSAVGAEKHYGLGAVDGRLIVAATYAGFPVTERNAAKLVALARLEDAAAKRALGSSAAS
jgi:hypothetical protein